MQPSLLLLLTALPLSLAEEPAYCKNSGTKRGHCSNVQKRLCYCSCPEEPDLEKHPDCAAEATDENQEKGEPIQLAAINDKLSQSQLMRIASSPATKRMWPASCQGRNEKGQQLNLNTDGFACTGVDSGTVISITNPVWKHEHNDFLCCGGQCKEHFHCDKKTMNLEQAAQVAADAVHELQTASGQVVKLTKVENSEAEIQETGVISTLEIHMLGDTLSFRPAKAELTEESQGFLEDLGQPLETLLTMQLTAYQTKFPGGVHFLFCAHGSTQATEEELAGHRNALIPQQRAEAVKEALAAELPSGGVANIGEAFAHHKSEVPGFKGGRFGSIVYKVHDASRTAACTKEDLYRFCSEDSCGRIQGRPDRSATGGSAAIFV